jgi:exonuclease SbcC
MLIRKIKLNNIRSYVKQELEFPKGSLLLSGNIGSGKTTILLAIEFALFGIQRGIIEGAALLRNGADKGSVELELEIKGKKIKLKRVLKRKKDTVVQDNAVLEMDGHEKELSVTELKSFVLNVLNYPQQLLKKQNLIYRYTVYTPQEHMKQILLSGPQDRIDIIRKIFNIDKYKRIEDSCDVFVTKLKEKIKLKEGQLSDLPFKKTELEKKNKIRQNLEKELERIVPLFENIKQEIKNIKKKDEDIGDKIEKSNVLKQKLAVDESSLEEKRKQLDENKKYLENLDKTVSKLKKELEVDLNIQLIGKKETFEKENDKKRGQGTEYERKISGLMALKERLENDKKKISTLKVCPVCKQQVTEEHRSKINGEIEEEVSKINENIKENEAVLETLKKELKELESKIKEITEKERVFEALKVKGANLKEREKEKSDLQERINDLEEKKNSLEKRISDVRAKLLAYKDIENQRKELEKELSKKLDEEREIIKEKASSEKGKKDIEQEIKDLEKEITEKERVSKEIEKITSLRDWLSKQFLVVMQQIEKQIMFKLNMEFNLLFKKWFSMLVEDALEARIDQEFSPFVEQAGYDISYEHLSGGERTALALAYRLALNQVINSMLSMIATKSILILDEPTEGFSSEQLDKMREVFNEVKVEQLILVSHEAKMEGFVDNVLTFVKEVNVTKVV